MSHLESNSLVRVPSHLKQFVVEQDYERYTPIDHAVWRYVMRQNSHFLDKRAHEAYIDGLRTSGISIEKIPNVHEMNQSLSQIGWGAVTIDGFIPAVAFFDFQAHGILPIACDIRQYDHIAYTPAPDIIHEAAGHSPIIKDDKYRTYLRIFGDIGSRALSTREDYELYEAIRLLSIVKEDPEATSEQVEEAERDLERKVQAVTEVSEATQLSRLYWWTVEYGLIGDIENPLIYGAGLLSSVGESMSCLQPHVTKILFSLKACIETDFDITKPQPQLFVCQNFDQLIEAVQEFAQTMGMSVGGTENLKKAQHMGQVATAVYSSGLQVSGVFHEFVYDESGEAVYLKTNGPTALAVAGQQLSDHGKEKHNEGFGSPIGLLVDATKSLEDMNDEELHALGVVVNQQATLKFASGIEVNGEVRYIHREEGKIVLIGFDSCTVNRGDNILFQSDWGIFDMAVGAQIVSVFAGAADREEFAVGTHQPSAVKTKKPHYSPRTTQLHQLFQTVRYLREGDFSDEEVAQTIKQVMDELDQEYPNDWLLRLELLECCMDNEILVSEKEQLHRMLVKLANEQAENKPLIENGLGLLSLC
ncbi:aromatic amino acid hydroxylase [Brevibacillus sp. SYSU BS000544]|uniref:aromatic amino acid hydroxylase n=1 Tax=Brevibacillus sp. SYSU BS000544 TaxID=3416443 RepID=UPI003CE487D9